jgi:hypothetical protein
LRLIGTYVRAVPETIVAIESITLRAGSTVKLPPTGVIAIVGGNNVGKSSVLLESCDILRQVDPRHHVSSRVVSSVLARGFGVDSDVLAWLNRYGYVNNVGRVAMPGSSPGMDFDEIRRQWQELRKTGLLGRLLDFVVHKSEPSARAGYAQGAGKRNDIADPPVHPMHRLEDDSELLAELNETCQRIFRVALTLDRLSQNVSFRLGTPAVPAPPVDAITKEYRDALVELPFLAEQGDGMKSLIGLLLTVLTTPHPVVMIDEPEAFLHPPQAFELGRVLAELTRERNSQIILATHDRNLMAGLLEAQDQLTIVRLDRSGDRTTAQQLDSASVAALWSDSVLRYSNVLDGLFHRLVVLAEADDDCRFYRAALDALNADQALHVSPSEVLFVPTGGKDGIAKIAAALIALGIRVVASPDLDILDDESKIKKLVEQFGASWQNFSRDYAIATSQFRTVKPQARCRDVLGAVNAVLAQSLDEPWDKTKDQAVRAQMRLSESPWRKLKRYGMEAFDSGQARAAAERLVAGLDEIGICVVRVGELEKFAKEVDVGKGPAWLPAAISAGAHAGNAAKDHLRRVTASIV